jgi:hypothetical protein
MKRLGVVACVVACGRSPSHVVDAPVPDAPAGPPAVMLCDYSSFMAFLAYRNGSDGDWQTPAQGSDGCYTLPVDDDYMVLAVVVCNQTDFLAEEFGFTLAGDGSSIAISQNACPYFLPGGGSTLSGTMNQAGTVLVNGLTATSATAPWNYSFTMSGGPYGLLAVDTAGRAIFDQGFADGGSNVLPTIDTGSGAPLVSEPLTISGLGSSSLLVQDALWGDGGVVGLVSSGSAATAVSMPLSELGQGSNIIAPSQSFQLTATDAVGTRTARTSLLGLELPPTAYQLLPDFTTVTISGQTASWDTLPVSSFTSLNEIVWNPDQSNVQAVSVSPSWLAARGVTSLGFDGASAPGYSSAWIVDPATAQVTLDLDDSSSNIIEYDTMAGASFFTTPYAGI